jgi:hypothetical protein
VATDGKPMTESAQPVAETPRRHSRCQAFVRNKPNFRAVPGGTAPGERGPDELRIENRRAAGGRPCGLPPPVWGGQNAQNKPNSRRGGYPTIPVRCRLCKTNPILAAPRGTGILPVNQDHGRDAHATVPAGKSCKTNPISGGAGWYGATRAWHVDRSCETKPISPAGADWGRNLDGAGTRA